MRQWLRKLLGRVNEAREPEPEPLEYIPGAFGDDEVDAAIEAAFAGEPMELPPYRSCPCGKCRRDREDTAARLTGHGEVKGLN